MPQCRRSRLQGNRPGAAASDRGVASAEQEETRLPGYFIDWPSAVKNVARMKCQLEQSFSPLQAENSVKNTRADLQAWKQQGLVAMRNNLTKPWQADREKYEIKYASVFLNHVHTWQKHANDSAHEWAGIFEGDAVFRADFHERLATLMPQLRSGVLAADIVYLGHCFDEDCSAPSRKSMDLGGGTRAVESTAPMCSHAYLLSHRGARILLEHSTPIVENNDIAPMMSLIKDGTLKGLTVCPMISRQDWESYTYAYDPYYHPTLYWVLGLAAAVVALGLAAGSFMRRGK